MVQSPSIISQIQLTEILGCIISEPDFSYLLQKVKKLQPKGKFWHSHSSETEAGIFLILQGKVRLIDENEELLETLTEGNTFGECSFFPDQSIKSSASPEQYVKSDYIHRQKTAVTGFFSGGSCHFYKPSRVSVDSAGVFFKID